MFEADGDKCGREAAAGGRDGGRRLLAQAKAAEGRGQGQRQEKHLVVSHDRRCRRNIPPHSLAF